MQALYLLWLDVPRLYLLWAYSSSPTYHRPTSYLPTIDALLTTPPLRTTHYALRTTHYALLAACRAGALRWPQFDLLYSDAAAAPLLLLRHLR